jgi:hypothetical protein
MGRLTAWPHGLIAGLCLAAMAPARAATLRSAPGDAAAWCSPTAPEDRLAGVVAPMTGQSPAWLVDASGGAWAGDTQRVKSLWVLARDSPGRLRVQGRRLDGPGVLRFATSADSGFSDALVLEDPLSRSVVPGGAAPAIMERYAFVPVYLLYPSPGCWELRAELGKKTVRIVQHVR